MAQNTIFKKIVSGELPCNKIYEDDLILAFHNINPEATIHALVIPKSNHLEQLEDSEDDDLRLLGHIMIKIKDIAHILGINKSGYRVISNCGEDSGQEIAHLHFHIIGGEKLKSFNG